MAKSEPQLSEGDLVEIRFLDIETEDEWTSIKVAKEDKLPQCKVMGYFLNSNEILVRIALLVASGDECTYAKIPRGVIQSIRKIEEGELDDFEE